MKIIAGEGALTFPIAAEVRREAGFDDAEIEEARRLAAGRQGRG
jgi:hypothetical protein